MSVRNVLARAFAVAGFVVMLPGLALFGIANALDDRL